MMKMKTNKKIAGAAAMLLLSTAMLGTSTYAWFTMNKTVSVTGMQVKAHAEEGLLINEVAAYNSETWREVALAGQSGAISLRPASTIDFTNWWHANSKKTDNEAGASGTAVDDANTVAISSGTYYAAVGSGTTGVLTSNTAAADGTNAARTVFYKDAAFGASGTYDDGEGYYVMYTYYLKSSTNAAAGYKVEAGDLLTKVSIEKLNSDASGSEELDNSLRVGVDISGNKMIFAPNTGADDSYYVTNNVNGSAYTQTTSGTYTKSTDYVAINTADVIIPNVNNDGIPVYVYIWFEGEDTHCKSKNLTSVLNSYQIDISFKDNGLTDY